MDFCKCLLKLSLLPKKYLYSLSFIYFSCCKLCGQNFLTSQVYFEQGSPHEDFCQIFKISIVETGS